MFVKWLPTFRAKAIIRWILRAADPALIEWEATGGTKACLRFIEMPTLRADKKRYGSDSTGIGIFY